MAFDDEDIYQHSISEKGLFYGSYLKQAHSKKPYQNKIKNMQRQVHYATVSEALTKLTAQGFTIDFNIDGSHLIASEQRIHHDEFEIVDVYRYEGNTDPADEATVYAIQSKKGLKGVLVTGYGASNDNASDEILKKLHGR